MGDTDYRNELPPALERLSLEEEEEEELRVTIIIRLIGYDLAYACRKWLKDNRHEEQSVLEVLLFEGNPHVGRAEVFWSHMQSIHPGEMLEQIRYAEQYAFRQSFPGHWRQLPTTLSTLRDVKGSAGLYAPAPRYWLDYFTLRQCQRDFSVDQIRVVIKEIGCTCIEVDHRLDVLRRSFCLFELYAAVDGGGLILCKCSARLMARPGTRTGRAPGGAVEAILALQPIDSSSAEARRPQDKALIDAFVSSLDGGFRALDAIATEQLVRGARLQDANVQAELGQTVLEMALPPGPPLLELEPAAS